MTEPHPPYGRYWNTIRYLKPIQIANRVWRSVYRPRPSVTESTELRPRVSPWIEPARARSSMRGPQEFDFIGVRHIVRSAAEWNDQTVPMLWRYHMHYFDDLNADDSVLRRPWHQALIERWIAENPPLRGVGWDPYPTSLRLINWIKWHLGGGTLNDQALRSMRTQLACVASRLEYHLMANHLLENARALIFGGLFFGDREADRWLKKGLRIIAEQLREQILPDGGHFERSPMYHQIVLMGLLDLHNCLRVYGRLECLRLADTICDMLQWSASMRHPDGEISLFN